MKRHTILIVDDIFTNRLLLKEIIEALGFESIEAKDGKAAIEILKHQDIDVVLMDIEMPVMNGLETTKYIREKLISKRNIPIIALTAHNPELFFDDYGDVGFNELMTKPYAPDKVSFLINSHIPVKE
jgi:CheY-like chemotaxis protein